MNPSQRALKVAVTVLGLCLAAYIVAPPLYWHITEVIAAVGRDSLSCPPCLCDCSSHTLPSIPEGGLNTNSFTDCMKHETEVSEEIERSFTDLLTEELKLREGEAQENQQRADKALLEAKKMASQYQKESDKCNMGMETCEEAREKAEATLETQRKLTALWESRARQRGWMMARTRTRTPTKLESRARQRGWMARTPIKLESRTRQRGWMARTPIKLKPRFAEA